MNSLEEIVQVNLLLNEFFDFRSSVYEITDVSNSLTGEQRTRKRALKIWKFIGRPKEADAAASMMAARFCPSPPIVKRNTALAAPHGQALTDAGKADGEFISINEKPTPKSNAAPGSSETFDKTGKSEKNQRTGTENRLYLCTLKP
jgi:hypothetical protein